MHSQTKVGRKRSIAVLLAAVVTMVSIVAGTAPAGAATPPPVANPGSCNATAAIGAANVTWTKPVPSDFTTGYRITIDPVAPGTTFAETPPPFPVTGVDTLTAKVPGLIVGELYNLYIQSINNEGTTAPGPATLCKLNLAPLAEVIAPPAEYVFGTNRDTIIRHFQEFLQRDPNFSELSFWDRYFFNSRQLIGGCGAGGYGYNSPIQYALDLTANSKIGPFCDDYPGATKGTQSGPEIDLINFLIFGEDNVNNPFDTGGEYTDFDKKTFAGVAEPVTRLYLAYFGRVPEFSGLKFWYKKYKAGRSLSVISDFFANSTEFDRQYGALNDSDFVTLVYVNVLARNEDFGGQNFWRGQLEGGLSRGDVMTKFSESNEYKRITNYAIKTITLQAALLGVTPTQVELDTTVALMNNVWNSWCIDNGVSNEFQVIKVNGADAFTTVRLTFVNAAPTSYTFYGLTDAADVQGALENLPNIAPGDVSVTGGDGTYTVEFTGVYAQTNVATIGIQIVTPSTVAPTATVTTVTEASTNNDGYQYSQFDVEKIQPSGRINLGDGTPIGFSLTGNCPQNGAFNSETGLFNYDGEPYYNLDTGLSGNGAYYSSPIAALIAVIRNSQAYKTAVAKPAAFI